MGVLQRQKGVGGGAKECEAKHKLLNLMCVYTHYAKYLILDPSILVRYV